MLPTAQKITRLHQLQYLVILGSYATSLAMKSPDNSAYIALNHSPHRFSTNKSPLSFYHNRCPLRPRAPLKSTSRPARCCIDAIESSISVEARTIAWARVIVCGLNLCPFAEAVLNENTVRVSISQADDESGVFSTVLSEINFLLKSSPESVSTTLVVLPKFAVGDFYRFHTLSSDLESYVEQDDHLVDEVMLACFHPFHQWGNAENDHDAINFDKRAPYAIINLLRAPMVDKYVEEGRTDGILERNQRTLQSLGTEKLMALYRSLTASDQIA